ncbi:geranylgeranyl pyrophosphate synthase [Brachybacterium avium]|uniref:Geranylgeranyl pyrophosphate synthase n=1 Tax=Brachybacterium avium TaxID=2017485 RepID=A0A220UD25_9MICO|nr:polyprenyl synthetase family protein [Brachybacterium avium]ASK66124.1 geranylgeranyl pyrophosphate synthase [Brachybacterium avium]
MTAAHLHAVEGEIRRLLTLGAHRPGALPLPDHHDLWEAFSRANDGGKRFRPNLLLSTHRALGGTREPAAVQVAAALELLHTALVVQDDVIDGDQVRRGVPSLSGGIAADARRRGAGPADAQRLGDAAGILAGDLGLIAAMRAIARCEAPSAVTERLLDLFESTLHATAAGELADVRLQLGPAHGSVVLREALAVAELKTALYSFQLPLRAGAILADASPEVLAALDEIGSLLGIGFQLFDDLLGVFGDESRTGKSALGDLREGKRTALIAHASTTDAWSALQPLLGREDLGEADARRARDLLTSGGSRAWVEDLARWHVTSAAEAAARHDLPPDLAVSLDLATAKILRAADLTLPTTVPTDAAPARRRAERRSEQGLPA